MAARLTIIVVSLGFLFSAEQAEASCASIHGCYCSFVPADGQAAVVAEVTASGDGRVDLLVEGSALLDPGELVPDDAQIASLSCWSPSFCGGLPVGYRGAFLVEVDAHEIAWASPVVGDRVACEDFDDFEGLDRDQLAGVIGAGDCHQALEAVFDQLGYEQPPCNDVFSSCGCAGTGQAGRAWLGLLVIGLACLRSIRRRPGGAIPPDA